MNPIPAYGSLSPSAEMRLYDNERDTWYRYAAQGVAPTLIKGGIDAFAKFKAEASAEYVNAVLIELWAVAPRGYLERVWNLIGLAQREMVRAARRKVA